VVQRQRALAGQKLSASAHARDWTFTPIHRLPQLPPRLTEWTR
jgi:hypothetical protein